MSKIVDENGFWIIKKNPISKEGVFPYLGHTISADCEPNKVYKVYRSGKTLKESVPTWDNPPKPFIEDHEMLGEGFTAVDDRHVQGVISNPVYEDGVLYADIAVYSESLKEAIENGKKELSLGYFCKYKKESGTFDGEEYDYVQEDMVGNHIALVDAGRCGSDVKVFDSRCTMDRLDLGIDEGENLPLKKNAESGIIESTKGLTETKDETMANIRKKIQAILAKDSDDTEKVDELTELVEKTAKDEAEKEEEKKALDKCGKDEDDSEKEKKAEDKCGKDEDDSEEEKETEDEDESEKEKKETEDEDALADIKAMIAEIKALLKPKSEDEDETKESEKEKETEDEDESEEEEKETEDEDESEEEKKSSEDSAIWGFGQDGVDSGEDEAFANYLK